VLPGTAYANLNSGTAPTQARLSWAICPSYGGVTPPTPPIGWEGVSHYRANCGVVAPQGTGGLVSDTVSGTSGPGGMSFTREVGFRDFQDGTSKTVLVSESRQLPGTAGSPSRWAYGELWHPAAIGGTLTTGTWAQAGATSLIAVFRHAREGNVCWKNGVAFGLSGMLGAYGGGRLAGFVPENLLMILFSLMMVRIF
jgi:hypothetical protein